MMAQLVGLLGGLKTEAPWYMVCAPYLSLVLRCPENTLIQDFRMSDP